MNKTYKFNMPSVNLMGPGCLEEVGDEISSLELKNGFK